MDGPIHAAVAVIVINSPNGRYRATLTETASGVEVQVFDRGPRITVGRGREIVTNHLERASLSEARIAVNNFLLTLPGSCKEDLPT